MCFIAFGFMQQIYFRVKSLCRKFYLVDCGNDLTAWIRLQKNKSTAWDSASERNGD
jgi:hypothetical protein